MAEIPIERRPQRRVMPWILGLLLLVVIAVAAWWFLVAQPDRADAVPDGAVPPATAPAPQPPGG